MCVLPCLWLLPAQRSSSSRRVDYSHRKNKDRFRDPRVWITSSAFWVKGVCSNFPSWTTCSKSVPSTPHCCSDLPHANVASSILDVFFHRKQLEAHLLLLSLLLFPFLPLFPFSSPFFTLPLHLLLFSLPPSPGGCYQSKRDDMRRLVRWPHKGARPCKGH